MSSLTELLSPSVDVVGVDSDRLLSLEVIPGEYFENFLLVVEPLLDPREIAGSEDLPLHFAFALLLISLPVPP